MAALRIFFFVMSVALAGSRVEALLPNLISIEGLVNCIPDGVYINGTSRPAVNGSLIELKCRTDLFGTGTPSALTDDGGYIRIVPPILSLVDVSDILDICSLVVRGTISTVCLGDATSGLDVVLTSSLRFLTSTITKVIKVDLNITSLIPDGFRVRPIVEVNI